jgi:hypothetical protein
MAIVTKLKETDLLDLQELFNQSNEESKKSAIEYVKLPDGVYVVLVKKFEFKTSPTGIIRATWTFQVDESEGEFVDVLQFKSAKLDSKDAMTRFLKDVRKFNVQFETFEQLLNTLNDQVIGTPCLINLETSKDNADYQFINIIVEAEEE